MKKTYIVSETNGVWSACSETDMNAKHTSAELKRSARSRNSESYKNDVEERLKATVDRMRSTSFDDLVCRYRIVFDFGTLNLFLINDSIRRWRVAVDEIIDRYSQLHYERSEESCLATAKRSFVSRCQETQPSSVQDISAVRSGSPTILTLKTSPSRTFKGSPCTRSSTSSKSRTSKEPVQSVRQGKRSVASLRARIQSKIYRSTFGASKHKRNSETSIACQVEENELLQIPQVLSKRRHQNDKMMVEPLVTISETSTSSAPPLPTNPPPSLSSSNSYFTPSKVKLREIHPSPYREVPIRTALSSHSYKNLTNSGFLESLCATPSVSLEKTEDLHTALSEISVISDLSTESRRPSVSVELNSNIMQQLPMKLDSTKRSSHDNSEIPRVKPRTLVNLSAAEQKTSNKKIAFQALEAPVLGDTPKEVSQAPAPPAASFVVNPKTRFSKIAINAAESKIPVRPPRRREAVLFSISPAEPQSEIETESLTNKIEGLVLDTTFEEREKHSLHTV